MLPVALLTAMGVGVVLYLVERQLVSSAQQEFASSMLGSRAYWLTELKHERSKHESIYFALQDNPALTRAVVAQDTQTLHSIITPLFEDLHNGGSGIAGLSLFGPGGELLFTPRPGDAAIPTSQHIRRAAAQGRPLSGLELDQQQGMRYATLWPLQHDGTLIGSVLISESLAHLFAHLSELFLFDAVLVLERQRPGAVMAADNGHPAAEAEHYPDYRVIRTSDTPLPAELDTLLQQGNLSALDEGRTTTDGGRHYYIGTIPLTLHNGQVTGRIVTLRDTTAAHDALSQSVRFIYLSSLAMTLGLLAVLYLLTRRSERHTIEAYRKLEASAQATARARQEWNDAFDAIRDPVFLHDAGFRILRANRAYAERAGLSFKELLGRPYYEIFPKRDGPLPQCNQALQLISHDTAGKPHEDYFTLPSGEQFISRSFFTVNDNGTYRYSVHLLEEVTERERMAEALRRENRTRKMISASNMSLVRAVDQNDLLQSICHTITELGGYRIAWVGLIGDGDDPALVPVAYSGIEGEESECFHFRLSDPSYANTPIVRAIHEKRQQLVSDELHDPDLHGLQEHARRNHYASLLSMPLFDEDTVIGALTIHAEERDRFDQAELKLLNELAGDLAFGLAALSSRHERDRAEQARMQLLDKLERSLDKTVQAMAAALEVRDPYTAGHQRNVATIATAIAVELGMESQEVEGIRIAATIHDLGKISVPAEILSKPGRLNEMEYNIVKTHSETGYNILKGIDFPWPVADMVRQHHERLDGSGYPQGLKGDAILPGAKIIGVADVVEAIASHRPYRPSLGIEQALEELEQGRGTRYDPAIVDCCIHLFREKGFHFEEH